MTKFLQSIDLSLKHLSSSSIFKGLKVDNLDCYLFFISFIDATEYTRAVPFAYQVSETVGIIFDFLPHLVIV